jgi:formylglycine-generating enzyme required for sulfatase activity
MEFDPYVQWLRIPADRRPPTYYDLLGLPAFEADAARIRQSALERTEHVRRYQLGQHSQAAIRLLGELSRAFDTLTTPERKQQYDRQLAGMVTEDRHAGMETVVVDPPPAPPVLHAAAIPPVQAPAASGLVPATIVPEPSALPIQVPSSPFAPDFVPTPAAPRRRKGRRLLAKGAKGAGRASVRATIWSIVSSAKACYWAVRMGDRALCKSLGEENVILHNFFRLVIGSAVLCGLAAIPWAWPHIWQRIAPSLPTFLASEDRPSGLVPGRRPVGRVLASRGVAPPAAPGVIAGPTPAPVSPPAMPQQPGMVVVNSVGMLLAFVPPGQFNMGSPASENGRTGSEHQHMVQISKAFYVGAQEVTQFQYLQVMGTNPSHFTFGRAGGAALSGPVDTTRLPVENVSWVEAVEFCRRLTAQPIEQAAGRSYRLPTEAEWEYACRASTTTAFHSGDRLTAGDANFSSSVSRTTTVGSYPPNRWGLFDMHGNVDEWCSDYYDYGYYRSSPAADPTGPPGGINRVIRGGSFLASAEECRSARRTARSPQTRQLTLGFRVVCEMSK